MKVSARAQIIIHVVTVLGAPLIVFLYRMGYVNADVLTLWAAEVAAAGTLAGLTVTPTVQAPVTFGTSVSDTEAAK